MVKTSTFLRKFVGNRAGNVAILTALCALPMMGMLGFALDYALVLSNKSKLDAAADAAAIAAITTAQNTILANGGATGTALTDGQTQGVKVFKANSGAISFSADPPVPVISVSRDPANPQNLSATVKYAATNSTSFGYLFGSKTATISGTSASSLALRKFINIYVVVDISQSMGIAASPADMTKLYALTSCVFGCHLGAPSNSQVAHSQGVTLRIDVIRAALLQMIDQAKAASGSPSTTQIGLYTSELQLGTLASPTNDFNSLKSIANGIDLGPDDDGGANADSYPQTSLSTLASIVQSSGDGSSASNAQNFVFIMTDGTYDTYNPACQPTGHAHCIGPYSSSWDSIVQLKQKATVGVIYTVYNPIYKNNQPSQGFDDNYNLFIAPIAANIPSGLQGCATSSKWFIQANNSSDVATALNALLMQSLSAAHLTN